MARILSLSLLLVLGLVGFANAEQTMRLQAVDEQVYALVGPFGDRSPENLGNNSTSGFVVTENGVVLIDPGGTYKGAAMIARRISEVTDQPVKLVINTGGQDHRWLGNGFFKERGAHIVTSRAALEDHKARLQDQLSRLGNLLDDEGLAGTEPVYADETFDDRLSIEHGGVTFELFKVGPAHTPGDLLVWLPEQQVAFAGDVVYVGRMLSVRPYSNSAHWLEAFDQLAALKPRIVVPGHGKPVDITTARADTRDYLGFLREAVGEFMDEGGDISQVGSLDQSSFSYLQSYDLLKGRNVQQVFQEMEWE